MIDSGAVWDFCTTACAPAFTQPSFPIFRELLGAWVLCPGRHTVTRMIRMLDPAPRRKHDAYHRFLRDGAWNFSTLWPILAQMLVTGLLGWGSILFLEVDDTLFHKTGRKVEGAGSFRDAVRSTSKHVVYALGLNLIVLTLRIKAPWGGEPLGLPINVRLYNKGGPTHLDLTVEMLREVRSWFPDRKMRLCGDGAYASLAKRMPPQCHLISRMRRDAALYEMPSSRPKKGPGRPRKKGKRLPTPEGIALHVRAGQWRQVRIDCRGRIKDKLIYTQQVLWYATCPTSPVLLVIVRDPSGKEPDDFFFTTQLDATDQEVVEGYCGRWSIEDTFRNTKQYLGGEDPQTWKGHGPERAASLSFWIYAAVWYWYIKTYGSQQTWSATPWYPGKRTPSFIDALAALRTVLWGRRVFARSDSRALPRKFTDLLIGVLAGVT